jgi:hypothetical protein
MVSENKNQTISAVLAVLIFLTILNSGYFFLGILKLNICKWMAFNACSLSGIVYLMCFIFYRITKKDFLLTIPILPLYYYGSMGLFLMPWNQATIFAQISHIVITLNMFWILTVFLKEQKFDSLGKGLLLGIIIFVPIFAFIQTYNQIHMNEFIQVLQKM